MELSKSHSKMDLMELINTLELKVVFSHADNKKSIQDKLLELLQNKELQKDFKVNNVYKIKSYKDLKYYLINKNPKKTLTIKEKNDLMTLCKHIIQYCKTGYYLEITKYETLKDLQDDMDYIKQFGDIPSVRRCCKLMNTDPKFHDIKFKPLISPQVQKTLDEKKVSKVKHYKKIKIRTSTPEHPIIVTFD